MGLTALRNKQGIKGKPANMPGGTPDQDTMNRLYQTAATKGPEAAHSMVGQIGGPQAQQAVQSAAVKADPMQAPRYQKMLADGVDPEVVKNRAAQHASGSLPGQGGVTPSGQTPGIFAGGGSMGPGGAGGAGKMGPGGPSPTGQLPLAPGGRGVNTPGTAAGGGGGGFGAVGGGAPLLPNGQPMQNMAGTEPRQAGSMSGPTPYPLQIPGSQLSPGAWGALGGGGVSGPIGGAPTLPNGQPMGGSANGTMAPPGLRDAGNGNPQDSGGSASLGSMGAGGNSPGSPGSGGVMSPGFHAPPGFGGGNGAGGTVSVGGMPLNGGGLQSRGVQNVPQPAPGSSSFYGGQGDQAHLPGAPGGGGVVGLPGGGGRGPTPFVPREPSIPGPGGAGGGGGLTFQSGNDPSQGGGTVLPNGQQMANVQDPGARQAAIARGLMGRMAGGGGAFNQ